MTQYYYLEGNQQFGPFSLDELRSKSIKPDTKVWRQGLPDWVDAQTVPEINEWLSGAPLPPIHPAAPAVPPVSRPFQESYTPNLPYGTAPPKPKNWLIESILATLFCCLPFGIAGIVNAANVDSRYANGDFIGAQRASAEAAKWTKVSFFVAIGLWVLYLFLFFIGIFSGLTESYR